MATFGVVRYNVNSPIGAGFQYDVVINELEVLGAQQQVRSLRDNSLTFANLAAGTFNVAQVPGAAAVPGQVAGAGQVPAEEADVANKVIDLFNSISKKKEKAP